MGTDITETTRIHLFLFGIQNRARGLASLRPIGHACSCSACRTGRRVPVRQPLLGSPFRRHECACILLWCPAALQWLRHRQDPHCADTHPERDHQGGAAAMAMSTRGCAFLFPFFILERKNGEFVCAAPAMSTRGCALPFPFHLRRKSTDFFSCCYGNECPGLRILLFSSWKEKIANLFVLL
jgi:hypothetical protein